MRLLDLFSGIGGFSLGLERAGAETIAMCEINPFCRAVLRKHWPHVTIHEDVTRMDFTGIRADAIAAGFPCQDISIANGVWGERAGLSGLRSGLWREVVRAIRVVRPRVVYLENVAALLGNGMGTVLGDLASLGYDAEWNSIPACAAGAPQPRDRVWIVAYPCGDGVAGLVASQDFGQAGSWGPRGATDLQSVADAPFEHTDRWPAPLIRREDDRPSDWMDRIAACGNAVVPQIPEIIGRAIMKEAGQ